MATTWHTFCLVMNPKLLASFALAMSARHSNNTIPLASVRSTGYISRNPWETSSAACCHVFLPGRPVATEDIAVQALLQLQESVSIPIPRRYVHASVCSFNEKQFWLNRRDLMTVMACCFNIPRLHWMKPDFCSSILPFLKLSKVTLVLIYGRFPPNANFIAIHSNQLLPSRIQIGQNPRLVASSCSSLL